VKVSLLYNLNAGSGLEPDALRSTIEAAGHEVLGMVEPQTEPELRLDKRTELVVAAGGDGTVGRVAARLAGLGLPLAILPFGTANNIATSLGILGSTTELVASWSADRRMYMDLGTAHGPWGTRYFVESMGAGLVPSGIHVMDSEEHPESDQPRQMLHKALRKFLDVLRQMAPHPCRLGLDGEDSEEELLLVQVLNLRAVGPGLELAPDGDPSDGLFDVVTAGEAERKLVERYLHDRIEGRPAALRLPVRRARQVEITGFDRIHIDDEVEPDLGGKTVLVKPAPWAIEVLKGPAVRA
jgi:diacylglycerol kinase (ATP)